MIQTRGLHIHFIVWAAMNCKDNNYTDVVYVDVVAVNMAAAIDRAKQLCPNRKFYRVNNIIEHHDHE